MAQKGRPVLPGHGSQLNPLWFNPMLAELVSIPDPHIWAARGIKCLKQICTEGEVRPLDREVVLLL